VEAGLSLLPVALGFVWTFGIMGATGMALNPANVIALPLLFGIGVDAGVHMVHRHRQAPHVTPAGLTAGTGHAITLTSLTAIIGFGSLTVAEHRGIHNLGVVLALGLTLTLVACWLVLPPLLSLRHRRRSPPPLPASHTPYSRAPSAPV
jgi:predicted RND superfamily exporter protein